MGKDSLTRYIQRRCFNRNEIKEDAWETIWSRSAMRDDGDNVFVIRCLDSTILDKATEDFTKYKVDHRLTDNDLDSNPMHGFLKARGGLWVVEPSN